MKTIQDEILLVIPYIKSTQGHELELSLTGWRKYCTSPLRIIVIGEYDPCIEGKAEFIEAPKAEKISGQYMPNIDVARKLDMIYERFHNEYDHFVLANDDEYPVRPFDWSFLTQVTYLQTSFIGNLSAPTNYWSHDMGKTRVILDKLSKPHVNYCNHHPFYFDMETFHKMSQGFDLANNSLIRENLYYNIYHNGVTKNVNDIRYGQWDQRLDGMRRALYNEDIKFVCNSVAGWSETLESMIRKHYNLEEPEKYIPVKKEDKIIVTFTSWKKRIHLCAHTVDLILNQSMRPDKLILNLSTDEFPNKEKELPKTLVEKQNDIFEIHWVKEDTKVYKKILPTLDRYPDDVIISIDDDIEYPKNFIEAMYTKFIEYGKKLPITGGKYKWTNQLYSFHGAFTLFKKEFFGPYLDDLLENLAFKIGIDIFYLSDQFYTYAVFLNGKRFVYHNDLKMSDIRAKSILDKRDRVSHLGTPEYRRELANIHSLIREYIQKRYGKTYNDLVDAPVIVNITTWTKRDYCLHKMLENLKEQELKPDKIILWLSREEYDENKLPQTIKSCVDDGLLTDIMWVEKNTYCHKRFECFKYFNDCYNIFLDDDILYQKSFLKEIVTAAKQRQDCVTVYSTNSIYYNGVKATKKAPTTKESHYNSFMGGRCCFPPCIVPEEVLTYKIDMRDKYVKKCDESWLRPFLIKHGIPVFSVKGWNMKDYVVIEDSQDSAVWNENKSLLPNGMRVKEKNFYNAIKITHTESQCKQLWPLMSIDRWQLTE